MSVRQYMRQASLIVGYNEASRGALELKEFRFRFGIHRGDIQTPNYADIRVYNLDETTIQSIEKEFTRIVVQGGYEGQFGILFDGQIKQVRRGREDVDTYIDITAADGDSAYNFAVTAISLAAGQTTPNDQISAILKGMAEHGIQQGYAPEFKDGNALPRGKVMCGLSRDLMRNFCESTSTSWSIQDGKLEIIPLTSYKPGEAVVITAATGMVGLPQQTQNGISVKMLLNPNVKIGQLLKIDNASIQRLRFGLTPGDVYAYAAISQSAKTNDDGLYYVMVANHSGDTRGDEWYTDVICLAIDATIPPSYIGGGLGISNSVGTIPRYG